MSTDPLIAAVLSSSLDAVLVIDEAGIITAWNGNAEEVFGYSAQEALGRQMADLIVPPDQRETHRAGMSRHLSTGEIRILGKRVKLSALHRQGHIIPVELAVTKHSAIGNHSFIGFVRDLTREMEAEAEIRQLNAELLQLSRLSAMGSAAAMIAHELNQPLGAAANYISICVAALGERKLHSQEVLADGLTKANQAILRAAEVVKTVRGIAAARPLRHSRVSVRTLVSDSSLLIQGSLPIEPAVIIEPDARYVRVAKGPVEQVFLNILKNAGEALSDCADPSLCCSARRVGSFVEVRIRDNGSALPLEAEKGLFSPAPSSKKDGLGIGLSICREIIEQHGGQIWFERSASEKAFCFTLPAAL